MPWGCPVNIDIRDAIGRCIWRTGVYELSIVELILRLTREVDLAIDIGANIGTMTGAFAAKAQEVWAFEPEPSVFCRLSANVSEFVGLPGFCSCRTFPVALSDEDGIATLVYPEDFRDNNGRAYLGSGGGQQVHTRRLDNLLGRREVGLMKIDVEGTEMAVLKGASASLASGQIRHIIFENHGGAFGDSCHYLIDLGYSVFEIGWQISGPLVAPMGSGIRRPYEPPNYLATADSKAVFEACRPRGWSCFNTVKALSVTG